MKTRGSARKIGVVSLGCAKNLVDSEVLIRQAESNGFSVIFDPAGNEKFDTAIINTCGFIHDAKQESVDTILSFVQAKAQRKIKHLLVMGCLSERYKNKLAEEIPEVDAWFGVREMKEIIGHLGGRYREELLGERSITTPQHYAYLKIAEGCNRKCSFCAIPSIRGTHISRPMDEIIREAEFLVSKGVREINVISQDTTYYGLDIYKKRMLPALLARLAEIPGVDWIRLHYTYPDGFPDGLLEVIRSYPAICRYIDMPLQHISDRILKSMRRGLNGSETRSLIEKIRTRLSDVAIRTTFITGYPGETTAEFKELKEFIREFRFDRMGVFTYSAEEGTAADRLKDSVTAGRKLKRAEELMELQEQISFELNQEKIGKIEQVIIDRCEGGYFIGRTRFDSPEVDNEVLIPVAHNRLIPGSFHHVKIVGADAFDLFGELNKI